MAYAVLDDAYAWLSARAFATRPRPFEGIEISTGTIRLPAHGFSAADRILLAASDGGVLPTGTTAFIYYSPVIVGFDLFQISGFPSFASGGSGWAIGVDPTRRLQIHLDDAAARIDECLTGQDPPLKVDQITGKFPPQVVGLNARMAVRSAVTSLQIDNAAFRVPIDRLMAMAEADGDDGIAKPGSLLGDWKAGRRVRPEATDQASIPFDSARAVGGVAVPWTCRRTL